jgi:hypothetical protein
MKLADRSPAYCVAAGCAEPKSFSVAEKLQRNVYFSADSSVARCGSSANLDLGNVCVVATQRLTITILRH